MRLIDPEIANFDTIYAKFRWSIPDHLNIANQVCERHQSHPGRIAVYYENAGKFDLNTIIAWGGAGQNGAYAERNGSPGTIYLEKTGQPGDHLFTGRDNLRGGLP